MSRSAVQAAIDDLVKAFIRRAHAEFQFRLKKWPINLEHREVHEVVGALVARQVTLATQVALSPNIWNGHAAPLFLRAMADVYINAAWVLRDANDRSRKFILYGLGQKKLELEHRRAELETRKPKEGELQLIKVEEDWLNRQRAIFLTDVNLGAWSGVSTRTMATEADCLDFYNFVYTPFSACIHSTWHHVAKYNLVDCTNPLHMHHAVPGVVEMPLDPGYLHLAAQYLQKTFAKFDSTFGTSFPQKSALEILVSGLDRLNKRIERSTRAKGRSTRKHQGGKSKVAKGASK